MKSHIDNSRPCVLSLKYDESEVMSVRLLLLLLLCVDDDDDDVCVVYVLSIYARSCGNVNNDECADK